MKVIVPMAGMGKRLRPHTLTTAKPLLPIAGKPIVQRLVEDIVAISDQKIDEIAYVVGRFGEEVEKQLVAVAESLGAKGTIHYQDQPLGTAHAILCAASALEGPVTVAFADTLFKADFKLDTTGDGVLWVQKIEDPRQFGVVVLDEQGTINQFQEKPQTFVSDLAMIGIYYFNDGAWLKRELQYLIDHNIMNSNEYQLPDALRSMVAQGAKFKPGTVEDWMDCGNKEAMVDTNHRVLSYIQEKLTRPTSLITENATIIDPCYIDEGVVLRNSTVGPHVSIGKGTTIVNTQIKDSIIMENAKISDSTIHRSMVGKNTDLSGVSGSLSIGDFSSITQ